MMRRFLCQTVGAGCGLGTVSRMIARTPQWRAQPAAQQQQRWLQHFRQIPTLRQAPTGALTVCSAPRAFATSPASAALVKQLRDRTGASMGKCRSALVEEDGDIEKAVEWLRKKGIKSMEKRAPDAAEALLALSITSSSSAVVEILAETDFVTRHELFQQLSLSVASTLAHSPHCRDSFSEANGNDPLLEAPLLLCPGAEQPQLLERKGKAVGSALLEVGSVLGERLMLGRRWRLDVTGEGEILAGYVHNTSAGSAACTGRLAAIVKLKVASQIDQSQYQRFETTAAQLARHVVALQPRFVSIGSVPEEVLEKEQAVLREAHVSAMDPSKAAKLNEQTLKKVIDGKTNKFYQDSVLLCQEFIIPQAGHDESGVAPTVERWLQQEAKAIGAESVTVAGFELACL